MKLNVSLAIDNASHQNKIDLHGSTRKDYTLFINGGGMIMIRTKITRDSYLIFAITLILSLSILGFVGKVNAQIVISDPNPYGGIVYPPEPGVAYIEPNKTYNLPNIYRDGQWVNPSTNPYNWSSSNQAIVSVDTSSAPYKYTSGSLYGDSVLTATYLGESANITIKVRQLSKFSGPVTSSGLQPIDPIFPGLTTSLNVTGLSRLDNDAPIPNSPVTFYDNLKHAGGNEICTATTDASGNASCSILQPTSYGFFCVYFNGDAQHAPKYKCNVD